MFELGYHTRAGIYVGRIETAPYRATGQYLLHHGVSILINIFFFCDSFWGYVRHIISLNNRRKKMLIGLPGSGELHPSVFDVRNVRKPEVVLRSIAEMQNPVSLIN